MGSAAARRRALIKLTQLLGRVWVFVQCTLRKRHIPGTRYLIEYGETGARKLVVCCGLCDAPYASYETISLKELHGDDATH